MLGIDAIHVLFDLETGVPIANERFNLKSITKRLSRRFFNFLLKFGKVADLLRVAQIDSEAKVI